MAKNNKLLLIGGTNGSVHVRNYYELIKDQWNEIFIITDREIDFCPCLVVDFSLKNPLNIRRSILIIREKIRTFKPDIVHVHQANSFAFMTVRANKGKTPLVLTTWGSDVLVLPEKGQPFKAMVKYVLNKADVITADAQYMIDAIHKISGEKEVVLANFGIEYDNITIPEKENIIYSNRLHGAIYNIDEIIIGFKAFLEEFPEWKLVIGANGPLTAELKELAKNNLPENAVEFIGFVSTDENRRQYLRAKIWASVPSSDGTAISLLEAMGYGCIPVISNLPANKEWITDGENGIIVNDHLSNEFKRALSLNAEEVIEKNVDIVNAKATKAVNKAKFNKIYECLTVVN